ncbi:hypothetical protein CBM2589_A70252 [Cupriavidus taiwanensis]|uniref:Uncharacterized protein n=1 Tax=Cupriavidus taiwanensis TaxID=164546 RepID=A0A375C7D1_9BURK|nr:hypothetical protein CBM2589_A70252 [Cupriavidus taiwanensis]
MGSSWHPLLGLPPGHSGRQRLCDQRDEGPARKAKSNPSAQDQRSVTPTHDQLLKQGRSVAALWF